MIESPETSWDIAVCNAQTLNIIMYIPRWRSIEISDQMNDVGFGRVEHTITDSFFAEFKASEGKSLFDGDYVIAVFRNGTRVFNFLIEESETSGLLPDEKVTFSGRGIAASLERAIVLPENFHQKKTNAEGNKKPTFFTRKFLAYSMIAECATTSNLSATYASGTQNVDTPGVGATLTATANGVLTIDGFSPSKYDVVLVKNQTLTQNNGFYEVTSVGSVSSPWVLTRHYDFDGDLLNELRINKQFYVINGTTNARTAWKKSNAAPASPADVGTTAITFSSITRSYTGLKAFWILFKEATTGYERSTKFATYGKANKGTNSGRRGNSVPMPITIDGTIDSVDGEYDSNTEIVRDGGNFQVNVGDDLLKVLKQIADQCLLDWHVLPDGRLILTNKPVESTSSVMGTDYTASNGMLFSLPMMDTLSSQVSGKSIKTVAYGTNQAKIDVRYSPQATLSKYGLREGYFSNSSNDTTAIRHFTLSALKKANKPETQVTAKAIEQTGKLAWIDVVVGDKVLVETSIGVFVDRIISGLSARITESGQEIEFTFDDVIQDIVKKINDRTTFKTDNADVLKGFNRPNNVRDEQPSVTSTAQSVVGLSNRVTINWQPPSSGNPAQYEIIVYRVGATASITSISRSNNIATYTAASHSLSAGDRIFVSGITYNRADSNQTDAEPLDEYNGYGLKVISVTSTTFTVANNGENEGPLSLSTTNGTVHQILEEHKKVVSGDATSVIVENLASPGENYRSVITPINRDGNAGESSEPSDVFTASTDPLVLVGGTMESSNYVAGSAGWSIDSNGDAEFSNGTFRGALTGATIDIGGNDSTSFHVDINGNMWSGAGTSGYSSAPFKVSSTGAISATSGDIASFNITSNMLYGWGVDSRYRVQLGTESARLYGGWYNSTTGQTITGRTSASYRPNILIYDNFNDGLGELAGRNISTVARTGNVATIVTASSHSLTTGNFVLIQVRDSGFSSFNTEATSYVTVTVVNSTTFTYSNTGPNVSTTSVSYGDVRLVSATPAVVNRYTLLTPSSADFVSGNARTEIGTDGVQTNAWYCAGQGSTAYPSFNFGDIDYGGDADTGIYQEQAGRINFCTNGNDRGFVGTTQIQFSLPIRLDDGTLSAPSYSFTNDTNTGLLRDSANSAVGLVWNGALTLATNGSDTYLTSGTTSSTTTWRVDTFGIGQHALRRLSSNVRFKENILDIDDALDTVKKLRPRQFTWKITENDSELKKQLKPLDVNYGFIVEEVLDVDHKLVEFDCNKAEDWDYLDRWEPVMYKETYITALSVRAIQQLNEKIEALEARIVELGG